MNALNWIWSLLPMFFAGAILVWVHHLQERVESLERRLDEAGK